MRNSAALDSKKIVIATLEAGVAHWFARYYEARKDRNRVGAREALNEARATIDALDDAKRELRQLELAV